MATMSALAQEVAPDFYQEPGIQKNRAYVNQHFNEHVDPFTGALQLHYVDVRVPGNGGFDIEVVRSYNSTSVDPMNPAAYSNVAGPLAGLGWTVHFGRVLKKTTNFIDLCSNPNALSVIDNPSVELPDGSRQLLVWAPGATATSSPMALTAQRWRADCAPGAAGTGMVVYSPSGMRYEMTHRVDVKTGATSIWAWYTKRIVDRNGNYADINYAAANSPEISSVTTNDGRTISFSYFDSGNSSRRIASITAHGATYSYGYTSASGIGGVYQLTSVSRPGGTQWRYAYNGSVSGLAGSFMMSSLTTPEGGSLSYTYRFVQFDPVANPGWNTSTIYTKTSSNGGSWTYSFSPGNFGVYDLTTVATPLGTLTYRHIGPNYDSTSGNLWKVGLLISKQDGSLRSETLNWDKQKISNETFVKPGKFGLKLDPNATYAPILVGRSISQDGQTYTTSYSGFDTYANPSSVSESGPNGGSRTTSLSYAINTSKWVINQVKDESYSGSATTRIFDGNNNLTSIVRDGVATGYSYDAQGNVSSATLPRSLTHNYGSYKRGIAQSESQPEGISISRSVSDSGNVTAETNGDGFTTNYGYDGLNRVTSIAYPAGNNASIVYGSNSKTVTRGALSEATTYDGFGYPTSITLGGIRRSFIVDSLGRRTFESNPGASAGTSYRYDTLNRVTSVTNADGSASTISYGPANKRVTDERGNATTYTYRAYGNPDQQFLMGIAAPDSSASVSISRNSRDLVSTVAQAGVSRSYGYNGNYYLTSVTNPETGSTTYGRDAAGNMTSRAVGASGTTSYSYDGQNRLGSVTYPGGTPAVSHTYNKRHKMLTASSSAGNRSYAYDSNGNLNSESLVVDGTTFTAGYSYNGNDQLSTITYPRSGNVVSYAPDVLGRPTQVSGFVSGVSYWPSGQVNQISYANGTVTSYGQNSRLWPSSFNTQKGPTSYVNSSYGYDGVGNLTNISDSADSSYNRNLGYDNINRLTSVNGPWGSGNIAYNGAGNITSQVLGGASIFYSYGGNNRLNSISGTKAATYGYDAYGSVISAAGNSYTYDGAPNLRCINCTDATNKIEYTYDAANHRATVTKAGVKSYEMVASNGSQLIEYTPVGNKLVEYIYLGGKRIAQREPGTASTLSPTVSLTSPTAGASFTAPATIDLSANAAASSGRSIAQVEFYNGTTLLNTDTTAPFSFGWSNVAAGSYSVTARAVDSTGAATVSSAVSVVVGTAPTTTWQKIADEGGSFTLTGTQTVRYGAGSSWTQRTLSGTGQCTNAFFGIDPIPGTVKTCEVLVTAGAVLPPTVTLTTPAAGTSFTAPATIDLSANAAASSGRSIARVEFYNGTTLLNTDTTAPFSFSWSNVTAGSYSLTARAVDSTGAATVSSAVSVVVGTAPPPASGAPCSFAPAGTACKIDAIAYDTVGTNNSTEEVVIAYGKVWKYDGAGNLKKPATDLKLTPPYGGTVTAPATRPCSAAPAGQACVIDSVTILNRDDWGGRVESISAYGKGWNFDAAGNQWSNGGSDFDLMTISRYGINGPCSYAPQGQPCVFDTRTLVDARAEWGDYFESITAYGRYYLFNSAGTLLSSDLLTTVPRYGSNSVATPRGPCTDAPAGTLCKFDSVDFKRAGGKLVEVVIAYGRYWEFDAVTNAVLVPGTLLKDVPRFNGVTTAIPTATTWVTPPQTTMTVGTNQFLEVEVAPTNGTKMPNSLSNGKVRFLDGSTVIAEVDLAVYYGAGPPYDKYRASTGWTPTTVGPHTITVQYLGITSHAPSMLTTTINVTAVGAPTAGTPCSFAPTGTACKIDAIAYDTVGTNNTTEEVVIAYGRVWKYDGAGNSKGPAADLKATGPYNGAVFTGQTRPCSGSVVPAGQACVIDSLTILNRDDWGGRVESISAYGKGWNFDAAGNQWSGAGSGFDLMTINRYGTNGPCSNTPQGQQCKFDTRTLVDARAEWGDYFESITAYGRYYLFNSAGTLLSSDLLTTVPRYGSNSVATPRGPCTDAPAGTTCQLDSLDFKRAGGRLIEVVMAYGRYWEFDALTNAVLVPGTLIKDVPRFSVN